MATVLPFSAYRPPPAQASTLACPPYDVISTAEARALFASGKNQFLRVSRSEVLFPPGKNEYDRDVYERGRAELEAMVANGTLAADTPSRLYVYAMATPTHEQTGIVGCVSVDEYDRDIIKKHEKTRVEKEEDRALHIEVLRAHDEPVFLAYRAQADIDGIVAQARGAAPVYDHVTDAGVRHRFWMLSEADSARLRDAFLPVATLYVADGHHRSAAASRVHARMNGEPGEHGVFPAVIFADHQLKILPYHRLVRDTAGRSPEALLDALRASLTLESKPGPVLPTEARTFGLYLAGQWFSARPTLSAETLADPVARLEGSLCQEQILRPIFNVQDPRRDKHVDFVGGIRPWQELTARVDAGEFTMAVFLFPTTLADLFAVSDAGALMPPKSTWFEPKPQSGLFVHRF